MSRDVLLLSNAYWPSIGGIENSLRHLAQEAQIAGDNVEIIVSDIGLEGPQKGHSSTIVDDVVVSRYPLQPISVKFFSIFNVFVSNYHLYKILKSKCKHSPDTVVIARFHFAALIAHFAGFKHVRYLVPSVFSEQVAHEYSALSPWKVKLRLKLKTALHSKIQRSALLSSRVFVFSETMKKQCSNLAGQSSVSYSIVKPGVNIERFHPVEHSERERLKLKLNLPVDKPLVLFVGRFVKAKGVDLLLCAVNKVKQPYHLVLIGSGEEQADYEALIQSLNIAHKVTIVPPLREVEQYYRCADSFVMSSCYEPLGQTILEAFASGLPLIAFKKSETVNTATQELGMDDFINYAIAHSSKELAMAIERRLDQHSILDRRTISNHANKRFSWKKLYSDLVN